MSRPLAVGERVLAVLPAWLGDLVQCEPALRALALRQGEERLSLAGSAHLLGALRGWLPGARRLPLDPRGGARLEDWRGHGTALLFRGSFRSAWHAWRAGIPRRVGWARDGRGPLLTDGAGPALERGARPLGLGITGRGRRHLPRPFGATCVELVGRVGVSVADTRPRLAAPEPSPRVGSWLESMGPRFVLASVGSRPESAKAFPAPSWGRALAQVVGGGQRPVALCGGPGEEAVVEGVRRACAEQGLAAVVLGDPAPDLAELRSLAAASSLVLAADGGARHLAMAAGARVLWMAGPTDPRHSAEHLERGAPLRLEVDCGPCHLERCPLAGERAHRCMRALDPEQLATRALALLE